MPTIIAEVKDENTKRRNPFLPKFRFVNSRNHASKDPSWGRVINLAAGEGKEAKLNQNSNNQQMYYIAQFSTEKMVKMVVSYSLGDNSLKITVGNDSDPYNNPLCRETEAKNFQETECAPGAVGIPGKNVAFIVSDTSVKNIRYAYIAILQPNCNEGAF